MSKDTKETETSGYEERNLQPRDYEAAQYYIYNPEVAAGSSTGVLTYQCGRCGRFTSSFLVFTLD